MTQPTLFIPSLWERNSSSKKLLRRGLGPFTNWSVLKKNMEPVCLKRKACPKSLEVFKRDIQGSCFWAANRRKFCEHLQWDWVKSVISGDCWRKLLLTRRYMKLLMLFWNKYDVLESFLFHKKIIRRKLNKYFYICLCYLPECPL